MKRIMLKALAAAIGNTALFYPLILLLSLYVFELSPYLLAALFGLSLMAGSIAARRLEQQTAYLASAVIPTASVIMLSITSGSFGIRILALLILLCAAGVRGISQENNSITGRWSTLIVFCWLLTGFAVYAVALRPGLLQPYAFSVYAACTVTVLAQLLHWNARRIREAMGLSREADIPPGHLLRMNRGFMAVLVLLILLIGGATQLSVILEWLYQLWVFLLYGSDRNYAPEDLPIGGDAPPLEMEALYEDIEEESGEALSPWILYVIAGMILLAIGTTVFFLLRLAYKILSKWLPNWLKRLLENLRIAAKPLQRQDEEAYADTTEKLEAKKDRSKKAKRDAYAAVEPPDEARREYFRLVRTAVGRGYKFRPWLTPKETAQEIADQPAYREQDADQIEELVERYNRSRYTKKNKDER